MDRKKLRLNGFDYSTNGAYFITLCTKNKKCILSSIVKSGYYSYPKVQLTKIGNTVKKYLDNIPGITYYVIMPNHIHLIVEKENITNSVLSNDIRSFKTLVTKEVGFQIWQRGFYDHIIRDNYDYNIRLQYIYDNPIKWCEDKYYCE